MSKSATILLFVGLFLAGGVISFWKQKLPKGVILVLAIGAVMCLGSGLMRL
ncbi:hypothetical protein ACIG0C_16005 [Kitasatospora aureofaciens]|uniref:Amidotransferase n=1 Tax=Kitasatospora aureofaciens TaxID=1894 RepID=A0A8H9HFI5_KITAU|nr:hypothetical protein [Kitasatospora aureofaciens]UKZ08521.1 hypothetical protein BOQ63_031760 [Streptomyces viridifaciens]GGU61980.1 hypothetical protein GCM10010502_10940 [Kitasatospora aureofaciens]HJD80157.1 hypothetical protein [Kitasatospora aureofaciens]